MPAEDAQRDIPTNHGLDRHSFQAAISGRIEPPTNNHNGRTSLSTQVEQLMQARRRGPEHVHFESVSNDRLLPTAALHLKYYAALIQEYLTDHSPHSDRLTKTMDKLQRKYKPNLTFERMEMYSAITHIQRGNANSSAVAASVNRIKDNPLLLGEAFAWTIEEANGIKFGSGERETISAYLGFLILGEKDQLEQEQGCMVPEFRASETAAEKFYDAIESGLASLKSTDYVKYQSIMNNQNFRSLMKYLYRVAEPRKLINHTEDPGQRHFAGQGDQPPLIPAASRFIPQTPSPTSG